MQLPKFRPIADRDRPESLPGVCLRVRGHRVATLISNLPGSFAVELRELNQLGTAFVPGKTSPGNAGSVSGFSLSYPPTPLLQLLDDFGDGSTTF